MPRSARLCWPGRVSVIVGVALVGATGAQAPPAGDQLAVEWAPTTVARHGGIAAWSSLDPGTGRYNLVVHRRGGLHRPPVASRGVPFDVDVGVDRRGDPILTYSRCRVEPRLGRRAPRGIPLWDTARGCDIYVLSLARAANAAETKVDHVSSGGASEFLPSVSRGSIAFARRYENGGGRGRVVTHVYVGRLRGGSSRQRRRLGGPGGRGSVAFVAGGEHLVWSAPSGVDAVDVRARATTGVVDGQMRCRALEDPRLDTEPGCRIVREPLRFGPPSA